LNSETAEMDSVSALLTSGRLKTNMLLMLILVISSLISCTHASNDPQLYDEEDDEDYEPVKKQKIHVLTDANFEEVTQVSNLNGSDTWFVFFTNEDEQANIIQEEVETLVEHTRLYHVQVGKVVIKDNPNTVYRLGLANKRFSLVLFKSKLDRMRIRRSVMYTYNGPRSYNNMRQFIMKGYKHYAKDILPVPPEISYFERQKKQTLTSLSNFLHHFEKTFNSLGYGYLPSWKLIGIVYLIAIVFLVVLLCKRDKPEKQDDSDSEIEQEEVESIIVTETITEKKKTD